MNRIMALLLSGYYIPGGRSYTGLDGRVRVMLCHRGPSTVILPVQSEDPFEVKWAERAR